MEFDAAGGATSVGASFHPQGFYNCSFEGGGTFSAQVAEDHQVDDVSWKTFEDNGWTYLGSGAFIADPTRGLSNPFYPPLNPGDWATSPKSMEEAISRLATAVSGLLVGPIP
jgi:hypothetical protein